MRFTWIVLALFAVRFLLYALGYPPGDGDLMWQQALGDRILHDGHIPRALGNETFTAAGAPWTPQEWLFGIGVALSKEHGAWPLFAAGAAASALAALVLTARRSLARGSSPLATAAATALAAVCLLESFGVRAQVVAWPFLAAMLLLLEIEGPAAYFAIPLAALWSNLHASAMLAPILASLIALGALLDERGFSPRVRRLAALAAALGVAICLNPFGAGLPLYALSLFQSPIKAWIDEWRVTSLAQLSFCFGALPLIFAALGADVRRRMPWRDRLVLGAMTFLLLTAARNIAVFGIVAAPFAAAGFDRFLALVPRRFDRQLDPRQERIADRFVPAFSLLLAIVTGAYLWNDRDARRDDHLPTAALVALGRVPGEHRLFCLDFAWCNLDARTPRTRVFLDGRADPYPADVWRDYAEISDLGPAFRERLVARGVNAIVTTRGAGLDVALHGMPGWRDAFSDAKYRLWIKVSDADGPRAKG